MLQLIIAWFRKLFGLDVPSLPVPVPTPVTVPPNTAPPIQSAPPPVVTTPEAPATGYRLTVLNRWRSASVRTAYVKSAEAMAVKALSYKAEFYDPVEKAIGIPWYVVAAIDMREESFAHSGYLGNGDPWNKVSVHVPRGRGPFSSWYEGAIDALKLQGFDKISHWDIVTALIQLEDYNGVGYKSRGLPTPYVWSWTNVQVLGKYVADGSFSPATMDTQPGCAALLLALKTNHGIDLREA